MAKVRSPRGPHAHPGDSLPRRATQRGLPKAETIGITSVAGRADIGEPRGCRRLRRRVPAFRRLMNSVYGGSSSLERYRFRRHGVGHQYNTWPTHGCITCQARRGQCDFGAGRGTVTLSGEGGAPLPRAPSDPQSCFTDAWFPRWRLSGFPYCRHPSADRG